jgi:NAD(P)-dependent dehydrogenase (short-subunit alcohol dehydrogenase family)
MPKTWFITGASRGFGKEWASAALERGDNVAATARNLDDVADLAEKFGDAVLPIKLDVSDRDGCFAAIAATKRTFGGIDVVINNAGYGQFGMVEELSEPELRAQIDTNLFGALWVTQAALPVLREQGHGHVIQVTSIGGISAFPGIGAYHASKWALEGITQSLAAEVAPFGIKVTLIEPGGFSTDWSGPSAKHATEIEAYAPLREARKQRSAGVTPGDPTATRQPILTIVDAEEPPLRIFFGDAPLGIAEADYQSRLETWRQWDEVSKAAQG